MAEKKEQEKIIKNPFLFRYPPNSRFTQGAFKEQIECELIKEEFGESITDKESYRLSLASKRGAIGKGSMQSGVYMFDDGKYDPSKDYSSLLRKDLSIVEIDAMIENLTNNLKESDGLLKQQIESEIAAAKSLKEEKEKFESSNEEKASE